MAGESSRQVKAQLDIGQILTKARHHWLHASEIQEILHNYESLGLSSSVPPSEPETGSMFVFDKDDVAHFRDDGHSWRKDRNGRDVKESHWRLKVVDDCDLIVYRARGEENHAFQRRAYWKEELPSIVFVHYLLEVEGKKKNFRQGNRKSYRSPKSPAQRSQTVRVSDGNSGASVNRHRASSGFHPGQELQTSTSRKMKIGSVPYYMAPSSRTYQEQFSTIPDKNFVPIQPYTVFPYRGNVYASNYSRPPYASSQSNPMSIMSRQDNEQSDQDVAELVGQCKENGSHSHRCEEEQFDSLNLYKYLDANVDVTTPLDFSQLVENEVGYESDICGRLSLDNHILGPSISEDQLFSIVDLSPHWAYSEAEIKVLVEGRFLMSGEDVQKCEWTCMFGELEVPARVVADGLECYTPSNVIGKVPFYVTQSNRYPCSEIREFKFWPILDAGGIIYDETLFNTRLGKLLSMKSSTPYDYTQSCSDETLQLTRKISAMLEDDFEWEQMIINLTELDDKDQLIQRFLKKQLNIWLLQKIFEGGESLNVLDEGGQGVLDFAAALGYDWAIAPTVAVGIDINFRNAYGWTALHWAAYNGREHTVEHLISLGVDPGFVTQSTPTYPHGRTAAALAFSNGHYNIALSLRSNKAGQYGKSVHVEAVAALRILRTFCSWKCRKDFLLFRHQMIKIQAYVRGDLVRKKQAHVRGELVRKECQSFIESLDLALESLWR